MKHIKSYKTFESVVNDWKEEFNLWSRGKTGPIHYLLDNFRELKRESGDWDESCNKEWADYRDQLQLDYFTNQGH